MLATKRLWPRSEPDSSALTSGSQTGGPQHPERTVQGEDSRLALGNCWVETYHSLAWPPAWAETGWPSRLSPLATRTAFAPDCLGKVLEYETTTVIDAGPEQYVN